MINVSKYLKSSHVREGLDRDCIISKEETNIKGLQGSSEMVALRVEGRVISSPSVGVFKKS